MSEAKPTPGPWTIIAPVAFEGDDETEAGFFSYPGGIEGSDGNPVCIFGDPSGSATMFENAADHRLIAAAPDLLSIVKRFVALPSAAWHPERHAAAEYELTQDALAAIALAEGRS